MVGCHSLKRTVIAALVLSLVAPMLASVESIPGSAVHAQSVPAGGAPPVGSGSVETTGFIRGIDGDTLETQLLGQQSAIGLIGITAPPGNTACGREASAQARTLTARGLRLDE